MTDQQPINLTNVQTNIQKEVQDLEIDSGNQYEPKTTTNSKRKYIILTLLFILFCGGIIVLILYLTNSNSENENIANINTDRSFGFELEPGGTYNFESGNFTLKNTTNIIRSWMILNCSSSQLILYLNSTNINSYNIGSALLSIGPDIYWMPDECPVILGEIMNKTIDEYDQTIVIGYEEMETLFDEIFEAANFNINEKSPFFILNKDDLSPSTSSRLRLLSIDFDKSYSFSYDLVDETWNIGECELSFKYTMEDATVDFKVDVRNNKIYEISFLLHFIGVNEISFGDCGSLEIPITIKDEIYKIEKTLLFFNPFPIYIVLSLEAKPRFNVQIAGSVTSTNYDRFEVGFQYILGKVVFIINNTNKDDDNKVKHSESSSDPLHFTLEDCTYSFSGQFINELIVGIEFYEGLIDYQLPNTFTFDFTSTFPPDESICPCLDEGVYYQTYQFTYDYSLSHKLSLFYANFTPIKATELYSVTLYESDKECDKALFQSFLEHSECCEKIASCNWDGETQGGETLSVENVALGFCQNWDLKRGGETFSVGVVCDCIDGIGYLSAYESADCVGNESQVEINDVFCEGKRDCYAVVTSETKGTYTDGISLLEYIHITEFASTIGRCEMHETNDTSLKRQCDETRVWVENYDGTECKGIPFSIDYVNLKDIAWGGVSLYAESINANYQLTECHNC